MPASSINDQTPTKKSMEHDTGIPPLVQNGIVGNGGMERSLESLLGLSLPSNAMTAPITSVQPPALSVASREASALPSPSQPGLDLSSLLALINLNGRASLSNPLLATLSSLSTPSLSSTLQLEVALALASNTNAGAPSALSAPNGANPALEALLNGLLTSIGQPSAHTPTGSAGAAASRAVGPRFQASFPSARSAGLSGSCSGSGESEESLATTGNPNTIKRTGPNVTEHVYVPSSEHVAEIVGRQGISLLALLALWYCTCMIYNYTYMLILLVR